MAKGRRTESDAFRASRSVMGGKTHDKMQIGECKRFQEEARVGQAFQPAEGGRQECLPHVNSSPTYPARADAGRR